MANRCDACGADATYTESISTEGGLDKRTITASGCPNHYRRGPRARPLPSCPRPLRMPLPSPSPSAPTSPPPLRCHSICTGKDGPPGCAAIGEEGTATEAMVQNTVLEVPASPVIATSTTDTECTLGFAAIALNGVSIFNGAVNGRCELIDVDDEASEWLSFDMCSGHSNGGGPGGGEYHYHFPPSCLLAQAEATSPTADGHSPQIGWSSDGFPIYGPLGAGGVKMQQSSLDACSGQQQELPDLDGFTYRYYFTGETSNLYALPAHPKPDASDYPFAQNCLAGCTWAELSSGASKCSPSSGAQSGVTSGYVAAAHPGYVEQFAGYATSGANWRGETGMTSGINSDGCCGPCPPSSEASITGFLAAPPLLRSSRGSREAHFAKGIEEILPLSANEAILTEMSEERPDETSGTRGDRGISCTAVAMSGL